ncbi:MAG: hypothetical protein J0L92_22980 [Deltaproteobacteria bacterium]|nr:hypothetical protein [Deltaproteobacteria bacterium]
MSGRTDRLVELAALAFGSVAFALSLVGCSLVWTPIVDPPDAGLDAYDPDAWVEPPPDAGVDAPSDAGTDAYMRPPETACENTADDDIDGLTDCNDPDCFGSMSCCNPLVGVDYGTAFGSIRPAEWSEQGLTRTLSGSALTLRTMGAAPFGALWRNLCVPLGQGGRFEWTVSGSGLMAGESISAVLSPAPAPGSTGFLEELAVHVDHMNRVSATRAGRRVQLPENPGCIDTGMDHAQLGTESTFSLQLVPGVSRERSALVATLTVSTNTGPCSGGLVLFTDEVVLADDLIRTPSDPTRSCQDSPGLYFGFEVRPGTSGSTGFALQPVASSNPSVVLKALECASPGVFTRSPVILDRTSVDDVSTLHTAGGIGAPDLLFAGPTTGWLLAYDASQEDRSEEIFRALTLRLGTSRGAAPDSASWIPLASPLAGTGSRPREPALFIDSFLDGPRMVWAQETSTRGAYEILRANVEPDGDLVGTSVVVSPADSGGCESLREPTVAFGYASDGAVDSEWIFARCDVGSDSRIALWRRTAGDVTRIPGDVLSGHPLAGRAIAADVLTTRRGATQTFALWVLMLGTDALERAELHLFLADAVEPGGTIPRFIPYAGNPILRDGDGSLAACTGECRLTSVAVAQLPVTGMPDRLRFLFARARAGGSPAYEIVAAEQAALRALDLP